MTPQEALALLDRALSTVQATRGDHQKIVQALQVLQNAIATKAEPKAEQVAPSA